MGDIFNGYYVDPTNLVSDFNACLRLGMNEYQAARQIADAYRTTSAYVLETVGL